MIEIVVHIVANVLMLVGAAFVLIGGIGLYRLPDFYTRLHAGGVTDTLGAALVLLGLMLQSGFTLPTVKLVMILVFLLVTCPTSCHALAQSARAQGIQAGLTATRPHN